ncbi:MAG: geranylgeranyl reductase family protein [Pseudomonadota bacterium]
MYDLIIIGGGPSGSAAGRLAGKLGLETLLIEKETFPRYKPCGGAFSEQAMSYLDFDLPQHIHEREIYGARVHFRGQVIERHKKNRMATLVTRSILDDYLLKKAKETGIETIIGEKIIDYKENNDYVEVFTKDNVYKSKFVIIAEGSQGRLKNKIRKRDKKDEYCICIVTEIEEDNETIDKYIHHAIDIHFGVANMGYGWIFPHEKYYSVGIGGLAKDLPHPKNTMMDFLQVNGFEGKYELRGHLIPLGGIKRDITSSRIVLSGDAGGFVDPFYGEGISYAIRSGQIAVEVISGILLRNNRLSSLKDYESICKREFADNLKYALMLSRIMHGFPGIFFKMLTGNVDVIDKYLEVPTLQKTYKSYIKWLIPRVPKYFLFKSQKDNNDQFIPPPMKKR